ncbi:hypothetical protein [Microbacterium tumbae]
MTTSGTADDPRGPESAGVSAILALVLSTVGLFALAVFGLGLLSLVTDADIIAVPGLGQAPGIVGMAAAVAVFAGVEWAAVRIARPLYRSVWVTGFATALAHLAVVALGALLAAGGDVITSLAVAGDLVRGGASLVLLLAALVAGWGGIALRRTRARRPHWPWEDDEE